MTQNRKRNLLTTKEAAAWLRLQPHTLENMRWLLTGPKSVKHGGRVFYKREDLRSWSDSSQRPAWSGPKR
jgi:Helix-turn-helix domain